MLNDSWNRRDFLTTSALATAALLSNRHLAAAPATTPQTQFPICVFVKFIQSLSFQELAKSVAEMGFQGIEATVRNKGQILPEHAEEQLPELVEALKAHNLEVMIMASSINRADDPLTEKVLRTASKLGIKRYRMDYYRYDLNQPVARQLADFKPIVKDLAALNKDLGIQAVYQNHAGAKYLGASIWDLHDLLDGIPPEQISHAYDVRHATVEGGLSWPTTWNLVQPQLGAVYVKNTRWEGRQLHDIPLGEAGVVDPKFFDMLKKSNFRGPISLHVEYLEQAGTQQNLDAIRQDMQSLQRLLKSKK